MSPSTATKYPCKHGMHAAKQLSVCTCTAFKARNQNGSRTTQHFGCSLCSTKPLTVPNCHRLCAGLDTKSSTRSSVCLHNGQNGRFSIIPKYNFSMSSVDNKPGKLCRNILKAFAIFGGIRDSMQQACVTITHCKKSKLSASSAVRKAKPKSKLLTK